MRFICDWTGCYTVPCTLPLPQKVGSGDLSRSLPTWAALRFHSIQREGLSPCSHQRMPGELLENKLFPNSKPRIWSGLRRTLQASLNQFSSLLFAFIFPHFQCSFCKQNVSSSHQTSTPLNPPLPFLFLLFSVPLHSVCPPSSTQFTQSWNRTPPALTAPTGRWVLSPLTLLLLMNNQVSPAQLSSVRKISPNPEFLRPTPMAPPASTARRPVSSLPLRRGYDTSRRAYPQPVLAGGSSQHVQIILSQVLV